MFVIYIYQVFDIVFEVEITYMFIHKIHGKSSGKISIKTKLNMYITTYFVESLIYF